MFSRQQDAKRYSKDVSLALNVIGFSPSMVRWRQIHYDKRMKTIACYGAKTTSPLHDFSYHFFLTGSKQEGTSIWGGGDEDAMIVINKYICVHDQNEVTTEPGHVYICIEDSRDKPGYMFLKKAPFTKLDTDNSVLDSLFDICITENNYLSSQIINKFCYCSFKVGLKELNDNPDFASFLYDDLAYVHENSMFIETSDDEYPSIVLRFRGVGEHTVDILLGAFICGKPTAAINEWASRKRYHNWPSKTVVDHIVNMPSYVVPKGFKGSESRGQEFRISYTLSELQLIKALNETQLKVYILLKLLFQSEVDEDFPDIITSYCLKNVVFWMCETSPQDQFVIESLLEWLKKGLTYILDCVGKENLPMYLMPKRNLLEGKLNTENKPQLEKLLSDLIKEGPDVMERVRKIKTVVETLRSNVVVGMAMGYMLHRGEMVLVNDRDETLKSKGLRVVPACVEMIYTYLQRAKGFTTNPVMKVLARGILKETSGDTLMQWFTRLLSGESRTGISRSSLQVATDKEEKIPDERNRGSDEWKHDSDEHKRGPDQLKLTREECNTAMAQKSGDIEPVASTGGIGEEKQNPEKLKKHDSDEQKHDSDKKAHDALEQKHSSDKQRRIIEEYKNALADDPFNKEAHTNMGMAYTALEKHWEAAECYREALERDPGHQENMNRLDEVEKLLQDEAACSEFEFGSGEGQRKFSSLLRIPSVKAKEKELMENHEIWRMMAKLMSGEKIHDDEGTSNPIYETTNKKSCVETRRQTAVTSTPAYNLKPANLEGAPGISDISSAESVGMASDLSGLHALESEDENKVLTTRRGERDVSASFLNPFDLSVEVSEEGTSDETENDSDEDYEPSVNITIGPVNAHELEDVTFAEAEFGDCYEDLDDGEVDISETAATEPGLQRILSFENHSLVTDDEAFIVYLSPLLRLAQVHIPGLCSHEGCKRPVDIKSESVGSALYLKWVCQEGHILYSWCSQAILNRRLHSGDLLVASSILLSGNNYSKVSLFARFLKLHFVSVTVFQKIQRTYLVPAIETFWNDKQSLLLEEFKEQQLVLLGDGRMDSPGHCAQYCSYTMMENSTKKIISLTTMDKRQTGGKSSNLEKACLVKTLETLSQEEVDIGEIVTDAHMQISALMKKDHPAIKHSYDIWHAAKNIGKKIVKAGQEKSCKELLSWTRHIVNHFWHAAQTANTYQEFMGVWCGVLHHVLNEHEWLFNYGSGGNCCSHGPLTEDREVHWLKKGSNAHKALVKIVLDRRLQNNVPYFLNFRSTAELENFQNHILMYAAKRFAYSPPVYRARNLLAALDYNEHINRGPLLNKDGSQRYQRLFNKKSGRWTVTEVKKEKTYPHIKDLITCIIRLRLEDSVGMQKKVVMKPDDPRLIASTLSLLPPPPTAELVAEKKSRLKTCSLPNT